MLLILARASKRLEALLHSSPPPHISWVDEYHHFHLLLTHLEHERLVHLLVTLAVGLATLICGLTTLWFPTVYLFLLDLLLAPLFIAYLFHYRRLENTIQGYYPLLEDLMSHSLVQKARQVLII